MIRNISPLFFLFLFSATSFAQTDANANSTLSERYVSPALLSLQQEEAEVIYFEQQLKQLKAAFAANKQGEVIVRESAVVMALRTEVDQLSLKLAADAAQTERRKSASSGAITRAASPDEAPARDPFADATTPDEINYETMVYTLGAFERHAFDPSKPEEAARDFAKLDKILKIMQDSLAALKAARQ